MTPQKPRVFVSRPIPEQALTMIREKSEVEVWTEGGTSPIPDKIADLDGLFTYGHEPVTAEMMDKAPRLKVISNMGVGYDHIDVAAATERGIAVGNTPGVLDETTADQAFALLMATARNTVRGDKFIRAGKWQVFDPNILWGQEVHGATLGIIGMGRIGRAMARRARGFNMQILYHNRNRTPQWEEELDAQYVSLEELLKRSDFVSLHTPLTEETHHLIGAKELDHMKETSILVNTARGPVVDSQALYEALRDGKIAGAGLDVFDPEPPPPDDPLLSLDNVVLAPHLGSATVQTRTRMAVMAAENLLAGLEQKPLPHAVNPEVEEKL